MAIIFMTTSGLPFLLLLFLPLARTSVLQDRCAYTESLLYNERTQNAFTGEFFPISNAPSDAMLAQHTPLTRCFIPPQYDYAKLHGRTTPSSERMLNSPTVLTAHDTHLICMHGCVRLLYRIAGASHVPLSTPSLFYVLVVTKPEFRKCTWTFGPVTSNGLKIFDGLGLPNYQKFKTARKNVVGKMSKNAPLDNVPSKQDQLNNSNKDRLIPACVPNRRYFDPVKSTPPPFRGTRLNFNEALRNILTVNIAMHTKGSGPRQSLCNAVATNLVERERLVKLGNTSMTTYEETVKELVLSSGRNPTVNATCLYNHATSASKRMEVMPHSVTLICQFGCSRQYLRYIPTGEILLFLHKESCIPSPFKTCGLDGKPKQKEPFKGLNVIFSPTNTKERKPFPVVFEITEPDDDYKKAVTRAVKLLRSKSSFGSLNDSPIIRTKTVRRGKFKFKVILWLSERLLTEFR